MENYNNTVSVTGEIISNFEYDHEVFGEGFYTNQIKVQRLSGEVDVLKIMISERLIDVTKNYVGDMVTVVGEFRSYNRCEGIKRTLLLHIFVKEIRPENAVKDPKEMNCIFLEGYVCKTPLYRKTPLGREITDLLIAVHRPYGKSDYIPCITWGRNARYATNFEVGERIRVWGRVQSREYTKQISDTESINKVAYEVSVMRLEVADESN